METVLWREKIREFDLPPLMDQPGFPAGVTQAAWEARREEIKKLLQEEEYGFFPEPPLSVSVTEEAKVQKSCCGFALEHHPVLHLTLADGTPFSFPFHYTMPKNAENVPAILLINFRDNVPDKNLPVEEIVENGYAVFSFCFNDVTKDDGDFSDGLAGAIYKGRERKPTDPGKITLWSYAASRVCDFMETLPELDKSRFTVCGHSRLGKTALLTAAFDTRFAFVADNCSGCSGDAASKRKVKGVNEDIAAITKRFPYWFCTNYYKYADHESDMAFDQHFLLALIAPRYLLIGNAEEDLWAHPEAEYLSAVAAGDAWRVYGKDVCLPETGAVDAPFEVSDGAIGYHLRRGAHALGRPDWLAYLRFLKKH